MTRRMSGGASCAFTLPSTNSTSECTMLWGWITTSIRSAAKPNSQCASITSSPLFISVAESTVIFLPIFQVGCAKASSGVTWASDSNGRRRNGPPDRLAHGLRAGEDLDPRGNVCAQPPAGRCVGHRHNLRAELPGLLTEGVHVAPRAQADDLVLAGALHDLQRLPADAAR